jgi:hypothetical protein
MVTRGAAFVGGHAVLIDAGTFDYYSDPVSRRYFRFTEKWRHEEPKLPAAYRRIFGLPEEARA